MKKDLAIEDKNLTIAIKTETSFDFAGKTVDIAEVEVEPLISYETVTCKVSVDGKSVEYFDDLAAEEPGEDCEVRLFFQEIFGENCWYEAWDSFKDVINGCLISEDEAVKRLSKEIQEEGLVEIWPGRYLQTEEFITDDQESWGEYDPSKKLDFSCDEDEFWITTNDGEGPELLDAADLKKILRNGREA